MQMCHSSVHLFEPLGFVVRVSIMYEWKGGRSCASVLHRALDVSARYGEKRSIAGLLALMMPPARIDSKSRSYTSHGDLARRRPCKPKEVRSVIVWTKYLLVHG